MLVVEAKKAIKDTKEKERAMGTANLEKVVEFGETDLLQTKLNAKRNAAKSQNIDIAFTDAPVFNNKNDVAIAM
ncbi:hypothetical protein [Butyrivibrio sp. WCD3002]|uniref:hypothetical protein n=1 Tax=Butyrivibrio sp. WCD3002 TaxID=1280676 RepID=UPI0018CBD8BE|nr:hypothetical protein [Butyrivibrio sp. WCD3002]